MRSPNLYSKKEYQKIEIKYLFLLKSTSRKSNITHIAILTANNKYIEYEIKIIQKNITKSVALRIRQLFFPYKLTRNSAVILNDIYGEDEPLYIYLRFIRSHLQFNLNIISVDRIIKRISYKHKLFLSKKHISKYYLNKVWKWLIDNEKCYWINKQYDNQLQMMSNCRARDKKILRVGIYYMIIKNHLAEINERSKNKKIIPIITGE